MATITESTMRGVIFKALYTRLNAVKPTGWTIKSKMPQIKSINSSLPLIVFDVAITGMDLLTLDKETIRDYNISASFMFIVSETKNGVEDLDIGVDTIREQLRANQTTWTANGFFVSELSEEFSDMEIIGGNRLLTAALSCQIKPLLS